MNRPVIRVGARPWDHLTPLVLGDVRARSFDLEVTRLDQTPNLESDDRFDVAETSFARYALSRLAGETATVGLPAFVMSGFRHRCVLTRADSPLHAFADLRGRRVGVTGWPDSGNTWTRALVRAAGVGIDEIDWYVGPLLDDHPVGDRIGPVAVPQNVGRTPDDRALVEMVLSGDLDAIMTPFMPPGFHEPGAPLRHLLDDYRAAEIDYFAQTGFLPGIHLMTVRRTVLEHHPFVAAELVDVLERSRSHWWSARTKLADTTPWLLKEIDLVEKTTGRAWSPYDSECAMPMVSAFCTELAEQGIATRRPEPSELFADFDAQRGVA